jgi:hypothetical protein
MDDEFICARLPVNVTVRFAPPLSPSARPCSPRRPRHRGGPDPATRRGRGAAQKVRFSITIRTATVMDAASSAEIAATIIISRQVIGS